MVNKKNYIQGIFCPLHPEKYKGSTPIIYRSSFELKFNRWCDQNSNIIEWGSETAIIPYINPLDGKTHRYFVDIILKLKTKSGIKKYIVEIKPEKQTMPPSTKNRKSKKTLIYEQVEWVRNQAKWSAARKWAASNGFEFVIITEKDIPGIK